MKKRHLSRRKFVATGVVGALAIATGFSFSSNNPLVSVVKIENNNIDSAVQKAIGLLGGIKKITGSRKKIMLKPNLVAPDPEATTKPEVIEALARLMTDAGKEVMIGEGSAAAPGFNAEGAEVFRTKKPEILDPMQQYVFDQLGYTKLADSLDIPLVNLHSGELVEVKVPDGFVFDTIKVHKSLTEIDMLCSVPMMKTHVLATVTLGMKNLIGLYPGSIYCSVRSCLHENGAQNNSPGIAYEILDMVKACTPGLVVIDASTGMQGNGPTGGELVKTNLIIAGTNPLATDMIAARIMGFQKEEVPLFKEAIKAGMKPTGVDEVEIKGEKLVDVQQNFKKPQIYKWTDIADIWGAKEI